MSFYLTFDLGTTALKTVLIAEDGSLVCASVYEYTPEMPEPGWVEMHAEVYWQAVCATTRQVMAQAGGQIRAIGFSSQGQSFTPLDRSGHPLDKMIIWLDQRARDIIADWTSTWLTPAYFHATTGYPWIPPEQTVFKIAWLNRCRPNTRQAWKYLWLPDYIIYRLTSEAVTDPVTARMGGLFSLPRGDWDPRLLEAAEITAEQLPWVLPPGSIAGYLTRAAAEALGLPAGIPVCTGANDQLVGGVGAGNVRAGIVSETTGAALAVVASTLALLNHPRLTVGTHAVPGLFYAMTTTNTSAILLTWLRSLCGRGSEDYADFLGGAAAISPGCEGLTVLPYFSGGAPGCPQSRGAFLGLALHHTRDHLARAVMEACACLLREHLEPFAGQAGAITSVRSLGSSAQNDLWLQMKADLLNLTVERPACRRSANLGAAMLAAAAVGQFNGVEEASTSWYRSERVFFPDPRLIPVYQEVYERYQDYSRKVYTYQSMAAPSSEL